MQLLALAINKQSFIHKYSVNTCVDCISLRHTFQLDTQCHSRKQIWHFFAQHGSSTLTYQASSRESNSPLWWGSALTGAVAYHPFASSFWVRAQD
jgi:hypothetical protein